MPSAGLECLSDCRASAVQRLRTFSRAQHVVSTIICWCFSDFGVKQGEFFAGQLLQAAHEPYRIPVPSRAAVALPSPSEFSSSYGKPWCLCWRDVIVAGRCGKSSTSFVAGGLCQLRHQSARHMATRFVYVGRISKSPVNCPLVQPTKFELVITLKTAKQSASRSRQPRSAVTTR
jgi:hypothetical protein